MEFMYLLPTISPKDDVLQKVYHFLNVISHLKDMHPLVPDFEVKLISKSELPLVEDQVTLLPSFPFIQKFLEESQNQNQMDEHLFDLAVELDLYGELEQKSKVVTPAGLNVIPINGFQNEINEFIQIMTTLNSEQCDLQLPIPFIQVKEINSIEVVQKLLTQKKDWLVQTIHFFDFLTESNFEVTVDIEPTDFYFSKNGEIKSFIAFDKLQQSRIQKTELLYRNLKKFKEFINHYAAQYFYQGSNQNFNSEMYTFISKVVNQNQRHTTFQEVLEDFHNRLERSPREKKVGVFIDYANLFTGIDPFGDGTGVKVHFRDLLSILYDHDFTKRITVKYAVVFQATYESSERMERERKRIEKIRSYLIKEDMETKIVSNGTEKAKEFIDGEFDIDDQELIRKMSQNLHSLDEIILFSGDHHFIEVIKQYKDLQKTVKVIAVEQSTSNELREIVDEYQCISNYWSCLEYSFEGESQWVKF
jgi:uncharacterized LabA/DUF88 family protein